MKLCWLIACLTSWVLVVAQKQQPRHKIRQHGGDRKVGRPNGDGPGGGSGVNREQKRKEKPKDAQYKPITTQLDGSFAADPNDPILQSRFASKKRSKPVNVLLILADDLGYGDTSVAPFRGKSQILTPQLEKMAARGAILTNFHSAAPTCTPTRASLLTGMYPWRMGIKAVFEYGARDHNRDDWLIQAPTAPMLFAENGYNTYHSGKWHLGGMRNDDYNMRKLPEKPEGSKGGKRCPHPGPNQQGFQHYVSVLDGPGAARQNELQVGETLYSQGCNFLLENDAKLEPGAHNISGFLSYCEAKHAMRFMSQSVQENKPFYMHLWFHAPHGPWETIPGYNDWYPTQRRPKSPEDNSVPACSAPNAKSYRYCTNILGNGKRKVVDRGMNRLFKYRTMVSDMDAQIGMVLQHLEKLGIEKDTLVVFTSDNGPEDDAGSPGVFRGRKRYHYEGGIRVPAIVQWPGTIPAGTVINSIGVSTDVFPTFLDAAGIALPGHYHIDGTSLLPDLLHAQRFPADLETISPGDYQLYALHNIPVNRTTDRGSNNPLGLPQAETHPLVFSPLDTREKAVTTRRRAQRRQAMQERVILWHSDFESPRRTAAILYGYKVVLDEKDFPMEVFDLTVDPSESNNLLPAPSAGPNAPNYWQQFAESFPNIRSLPSLPGANVPKDFLSALTSSKTSTVLAHMRGAMSSHELFHDRASSTTIFHLVVRAYHALRSFATHGSDGYRSYLAQYPDLRYTPTPPSDNRPMITNIYKTVPRERMDQFIQAFLREGSCAANLPCSCAIPTASKVPAVPFPVEKVAGDVIASAIMVPHGYLNGSVLLGLL